MPILDIVLDDTTVPVTCTDQGAGRPVLLLHGGGGPLTVSAWGERLASTPDVRVVVPTHPGFEGTPRPETLNSPRALARLYANLLESLDLCDVTVVGNSVGGWIAAELGLLQTSRIAGQVLVDAVGIEVPGHPVADFFALTPREVAELSYADPATFGLDPSKLPAERLAVVAGNRATLQVYGGTTMADPTLAHRLSSTTRPTLVVWGEADRIGDPDYGRAYAAAVPGAEFTLIAGAGHLPQIETPDVLVEVVRGFVQDTPSASFSGSIAK